MDRENHPDAQSAADRRHESAKERYNALHREPLRINKSSPLLRAMYDLTGDYDTDLAAGKIDENAVLKEKKT